MIEELHLKNFKCFEDQRLRLGGLTILAGLNGMGKSSVIQSLLLLRQSYLSGDLTYGFLTPSGGYIDVGAAADLLFEGAKEDSVVISLVLGPKESDVATFAFSLSENRDALVGHSIQSIRSIKRLANLKKPASLFTKLDDVEGQRGIFQYLSAERNGPRKFLPMSHRHAGSLDLGTQGEYVLHVLQAQQDKIRINSDDPRHTVAASERLRDQLEVWLNEVSPGARLQITPFPQADLLASTFSYGQAGQLRTREYRATNVGFGLSFVLPVLVALLASPADALLLIENPEAHLHPRGQTRIGMLCALAAAAGVQVIIETHSDHVLDGCRIAVREQRLSSDKASFHYFSREGGRLKVVSPAIDSEGRLSEWPDGFFDQHRRNAGRLVRPRPSQG